MDSQEIDSALDELENRLDRLRSLYEQYFMGIEKIEPTVPRKDIDRRFWILRRTQIRNTARRFRLQTLVQRYNTFQQHWTRICREIENGTYVRHLLKAQKNLGAEPKTWAAKKRLGLLRRDVAQPGGAPANGAAASNGSASVIPAAASSVPPAAAPRESAPPSAAPRAPSAFPSVRPAELQPLDLELGESAKLPLPRRSVPPASPLPGTAGGKPPIPVRPGVVAVNTGSPAIAPRPASALPTSAIPRPASAIPRPASAIPRPASAIPRPAPPAPVTAPKPAAPATPAKPPAPSVAAKPALPTPAANPATPTAPAKPAAPATSAKPAAPAGTNGAAAAARAAPAAAVQPPRAAPQSPAAASPKPAPGLSDERVAQLHAELNAARRQLNQSSSVSIDSLAKSLRETESKLKTQHGGRPVDFQVIIKDGKPVVKPVVRR